MTITLRPATMDDEDLLFAWHHDPETRAASIVQEGASREDHVKWLKTSLADESSRIIMAERDATPVGVVRLYRCSSCRLRIRVAWTVAPEARGCGVGTEMVHDAIRTIVPPAVAVAMIRGWNVRSRRVAERAGMVPMASSREFVFYGALVRDAKTKGVTDV